MNLNIFTIERQKVTKKSASTRLIYGGLGEICCKRLGPHGVQITVRNGKYKMAGINSDVGVESGLDYHRIPARCITKYFNFCRQVNKSSRS
jgi:hypothetical protein